MVVNAEIGETNRPISTAATAGTRTAIVDCLKLNKMSSNDVDATHIPSYTPLLARDLSQVQTPTHSEGEQIFLRVIQLYFINRS